MQNASPKAIIKSAIAKSPAYVLVKRLEKHLEKTVDMLDEAKELMREISEELQKIDPPLSLTDITLTHRYHSLSGNYATSTDHHLVGHLLSLKEVDKSHTLSCEQAFELSIAALEYGFDPSKVNGFAILTDLFTPNFSGALKGELFDALIKRGVRINDVESETNNTALHVAAKFADVELTSLLLNAGADTTLTNEFGETPLMTAVSTKFMSDRYKNIFFTLIDGGCSIFDEHEIDKRSTLLHLCMNQKPYGSDDTKQKEEVIVELISRGLDPRQEDGKGQTAAELALAYHRPKLAELLKQMELIFKEKQALESIIKSSSSDGAKSVTSSMNALSKGVRCREANEIHETDECSIPMSPNDSKRKPKAL